MEEVQLLLKYRNNYADEFDVKGFLVLSQSAWEEHKELASKVFKQNGEVEVGFGTNESISYHSLEDYLGSFKVSELTQDQYQVLWYLFGNRADKIENGMVCLIDEGYLDEDEEDED